VKAAREGFRSVVLDVDSTLCGIEGIDWLAAQMGPRAASTVASLTARAMDGELALEDVYRERLAAVIPDARSVDALGKEYARRLAPGARGAIERWLASGIRVILVSGGIRQAILRVAEIIGIRDDDVHAVTLLHDSSGHYVDFDRSSPLATAMGKRDTVGRLALPGPSLAVGDGMTDLAMREVVDAFAAFTGFVSRAAVTEHADFVVPTFEELDSLVQPPAVTSA
jgi:phosphoserine phosphatase